VRELRD